MYPNCRSRWMNTWELGSTPASDPVVTSSKPQLLRSPPWEMIIRIIPLLVDSVEVFRKGKKKKGVLCSMQEDCQNCTAGARHGMPVMKSAF